MREIYEKPQFHIYWITYRKDFNTVIDLLLAYHLAIVFFNA